jgi:hypothetical protein
MIRWSRIRWGWVFPVLLVLLVILVVLLGFGYTRLGSAVSSRAAWIIVPTASVLFIVSKAIRGVRVSIWNVATYSLAIYATVAIMGGGHSWYTKALLALVVLIPLRSIANAVDRADRRHDQNKRDNAATSLNDAIANGVADIGRYTVYLRPFASTNRLEAQSQEGAFGQGEIPVHLDLESVLTRALRKECPLVALGRPGDMDEGAGRIQVSDDEWQSTIARLSEQATMLLIIPSAHPGTLWEFRRLAKSPLLTRTLMVMPEQPRKTPSCVMRSGEKDRLFDGGLVTYKPSSHTYDIPSDWANARAAADAFGLHLPAYSPAGALFTIDPVSGDVNRIAPLALAVLARRSAYIQAAICHLGLWPWHLSRKTGLADDFEAATFGGGRTLEYALVVAADAFLTWGRTAEGMEFLRRAGSVCRRPLYSSEEGRRLIRVQQVNTQCKELCSPPVRKENEVADAHEAAGQQVE